MSPVINDRIIGSLFIREFMFLTGHGCCDVIVLFTGPFGNPGLVSESWVMSLGVKCNNFSSTHTKWTISRIGGLGVSSFSQTEYLQEGLTWPISIGV